MSTLPHCFFRHLNSTVSYSSILIFRESGADVPAKASSGNLNKKVGKAKETQEVKKSTSESLDSLKRGIDKVKELKKQNDEKVRRYAATPKDSIAFVDKLIRACYDNYPMAKGEAEQFETGSERIQKETIARLKSSLDQAGREEIVREFMQDLILLTPNFIAGVTPLAEAEEGLLSSVD